MLNRLQRLIDHLIPLANASGVQIQLDPTFQPLYELYDGIVLQLVCQGTSAPVVIARGGRYDTLVRRLGGQGTDATGMGFSYCVDHIRNLPGDTTRTVVEESSALICFNKEQCLEKALIHQASLHAAGRVSCLDHRPCQNRNEAERRLAHSGCETLEWIGD